MKHSRRCAPVNGHAGREGEETGSCDVCQLGVDTERLEGLLQLLHSGEGLRGRNVLLLTFYAM